MYRVSIELWKHEWKFGRTRNAVMAEYIWWTLDVIGELGYWPVVDTFYL